MGAHDPAQAHLRDHLARGGRAHRGRCRRPRAFLPRGVNQNIQDIDYTATAPGCYWVNTEKTPGIYPTGVAYGVLAVFKVDANVLQLMANETSLWWRMNVNDRWSAWRQA